MLLKHVSGSNKSFIEGESFLKGILRQISLRQFCCRATIVVLLSVLVFASEILFFPAPKSFAQSIGGHIDEHSQSLLQVGTVPPSDAQCRSEYNIDCYGPQDMRKIYNINPLIDAGYTGKGQTIVIIDSYGSPTLVQDLKTFDTAFSIPDPPSLKILAPLGTHTFDDTVADDDAWALETTLDVEWAHAIAPDANIVLLTSPVDETQGIQGLPEFLQLEQYALDNHLGQIISQSWGTAENTLFTAADEHIFTDYDNFYKRAAAEHVSVFATSGDYGTANDDTDGNVYPYPTVLFPGSSPYVTTVGGTMLQTDADSNYLGETAWDVAPYVATGGGISQYYPEPAYQTAHLPASVQQQLNGKRGTPDIAYNAYAGSSVLMYFSFRGDAKAGFYNVGGTSEGAPQWAGITAIANQYSHCALGFLNPALYSLADSPAYATDFHDITQGNNALYGVPGYNAAAGWDLLTGWGSPNVTNLVNDLTKKH
jgi:subtilase family serine protease